MLRYVTDNPPDLMFANEVDIRRVHTEQKTSEPVVQNLRDVKSLDFDVLNKQMYWADSTLNKISRGFVNGSSVEEVRRSFSLFVFEVYFTPKSLWRLLASGGRGS